LNIGQIYDDTVADHYDRDQHGLLGGARGRFLQQMRTHLAGAQVEKVLDLAVGTGESLTPLKEIFPGAAFSGVDLSARMLEVAKTKLDFEAIHDDVNNAGRHFAPQSFDLVLMHFLTTFIDGAKVVRESAELLAPGGYYSIVSSTYEAFPVLRELSLKVVSKEFLDEVSPAPRDPEVIASFLRGAGLEIVACEQFEKEVSFPNFFELYEFALKSGFFTHILAHVDAGKVTEFQNMGVQFPVVDRYKAAVVLARKP
jgi:ubiquinone/menaquinone biosynthesis C-methylase UbiE